MTKPLERADLVSAMKEVESWPLRPTRMIMDEETHKFLFSSRACDECGGWYPKDDPVHDRTACDLEKVAHVMDS